ncbi:hypothetical protein TanjilG_11571 [Lupinus angustifolius]|uniref:Uncharacterized protein n=1 Tax=Lupinus angustifolius TaxID=3871 RepID=A0A1J7GCN8_LUPAN|nr:hypothetical protein TanjilG_11571 [Lupinus angustifolius]
MWKRKATHATMEAITKKEVLCNNHKDSLNFSLESDFRETNAAEGMKMGGIDDEDMDDENEGMSLNVQGIDMYWL